MTNLKLAIVVSEFNAIISEKLLAGAVAHLGENGIASEQLTIIHVPGAVEIPLTAKLLAKSKKYHAIICLGAVIRGDTSHYDYVCEQVSQGCQQVMLEHEIPVIFGILTTNDARQAQQRVSDNNNKGKYAAAAALKMVAVVRGIMA